uniref:Calcium-binding protein n=1 Tax=Gymnema sylvestre TaxID=4068 RepID=A0AA96NPC8_GYMSY|nr:calcium-binding protein [Gymnema sylvestre]
MYMYSNMQQPADQPETIPKSFGCLPQKTLKLNLSRSRSRCSSSLSSPRNLKSPGGGGGGEYGSTSSRGSSSSSSNITTTRSKEEEEYREVFRRFDNDNDGKVSASGLRSYFASVGEYMSEEDAEAVITDLDTDGDNLIDFQDFLRLMTKNNKEGGEEDLKAAFGMFEMEKGCGRITPKSLQRVLSRLGDSKSYDECVAMIQVFDTQGKGEIGYPEFQEMMMHGLN